MSREIKNILHGLKRKKYSLSHCNLLLFITILLISFSSCKKENMFDCFKSTGEITTERRNVDGFSEVEVRDNVNVIFVQDTLSFVEVNAGENLLPNISVEVQNGKLYIENHNTCNWVRDFTVPINIYVHVIELKTLHTFGSGKINSLNTLVTNVVEINNHNTGDIDLKISANEIYCKQHACYGDNKISGSAQYVYIYNTGNGFCDCSNIVSSRATVISISTGPSYINSCDELGTEIKSSGNVFYRGNPVIHSTVTGTGMLIQY